MTSQPKYFVFIFPAKGEIRSLLNLSVFALSPSEKWPAHVTVAGPFQRRPSSRAQPNFDGTIFTLGVWNFFSQGLNTVFLKVGMEGIYKYWLKPSFIGDPVPHISLYNGSDREFARSAFNELEPKRFYFSFRTSGIEVVKSTAQRQFNLREEVDLSCLSQTKDMTLDDLAALSARDRIQIAALALDACRGKVA